MIKQFLLGFALLSAGCSQLDSIRIGSSTKRVYQVRDVWVTQGPQKVDLRYRRMNRMSPVIWNKLVIQGNSVDGLAAYDFETGRLQWRIPIQNGIEAEATIINDRLFVGALDGQFYSIDLSKGRILWSFPTRIENLSAPLLVEDTIYFMSGNNTVYALDAVSGKQKWIYTRQDPDALSIRGGSKPVYRNGSIYFGFSDGYVVSLLAANGAVKWERQLNKNKKYKDIDSSLVLVDDTIYVSGFDDALYSIKAATGETIWKLEEGGYGALLADNDFLYYASSSRGQMVAVNLKDGQKAWIFEGSGKILSPPSLLKGVLVFGELNGRIYFLNAKSGKKLSQYDPGMGTLSQPTVDPVTDSVLFISNEANVYRLEAKWAVPNHFNL